MTTKSYFLSRMDGRDWVMPIANCLPAAPTRPPIIVAVTPRPTIVRLTLPPITQPRPTPAPIIITRPTTTTTTTPTTTTKRQFILISPRRQEESLNLAPTIPTTLPPKCPQSQFVNQHGVVPATTLSGFAKSL